MYAYCFLYKNDVPSKILLGCLFFIPSGKIFYHLHTVNDIKYFFYSSLKKSPQCFTVGNIAFLTTRINLCVRKNTSCEDSLCSQCFLGKYLGS